MYKEETLGLSGVSLYQGDCLEVMRDLPDNSVDLVLTDPPYGTTAHKWDTIIPLEPMWEQLNRVTKENAAVLIFGSQPFTTTLISSNLKMFRYEYIWLKERGQNFVHAKKLFMKAHENICVFYKKLPTYNPQMTKAPEKNIRKPQYNKNNSDFYKVKDKKHSEDYDPTLRYPLSYGLFSSGRARDKVHPTQKPVELLEYMIKTYTNEGETVLDFTMGSGSTGVACKNLNRNFIGIELDEEYFKIAKERMHTHL